MSEVEPVNLWQAAVDAIYARLAEALGPDVPVFQDLKEGTQPPFVLVGDMDGDNAGGKYEIEDDLTVDIQYVTRGTRRALLDIMWRGRMALRDQPIAADGASFSAIRWVTGSTATGEDGVTRAGIQQFQLFAEPA